MVQWGFRGLALFLKPGEEQGRSDAKGRTGIVSGALILCACICVAAKDSRALCRLFGVYFSRVYPTWSEARSLAAFPAPPPPPLSELRPIGAWLARITWALWCGRKLLLNVPSTDKSWAGSPWFPLALNDIPHPLCRPVDAHGIRHTLHTVNTHITQPGFCMHMVFISSLCDIFLPVVLSLTESLLLAGLMDTSGKFFRVLCCKIWKDNRK